MSRRASDANSVLSFTFLDVLMCTMGSLLLLLVVFGVIAKKATRARRAGESANITTAALTAPTPAKAAAPSSAPAKATDNALPNDPVELAKALESLKKQQADLDETKQKIAARRREQQDLISHLEDHERRLEHDLGKLYVSLQALDAAESKRTTDRDQAAAEVKHLEEVIRDTEAQLDEMRKNGGKKKSFAIVPYKGANGTFRRPVFVECTADAVTIQPEGIRFTVEDFDGPLRSGNPLAAAIRAAHEELNARAVAAGQTDMPDPYPLLIVRPDGAGAYAVAVSAIRSWDADYGYEFVEADWKLKYPEPDPRLGQVMTHAVDQARQRQALLAKVAPMEYAPRLSGGGSGHGGSGGGAYADGGDGFGGGGGFDDLAGGGNRIGSHAGEGSMGGGEGDGSNSLRVGGRYGGGGGGGNFSDEFAGDGGIAVAAVSTNGPVGASGGGIGGPSGPGIGGGIEGGAGGAGGDAAATAQGGGGPSTADSEVGPRYGAGGAPGGAEGSQSAANGNSNAPSAAQSAAADGTGSGVTAGAGSGPAGASANGGGAQGSSAGGAGGSAPSGSATGSMASSGGAGGSAGGGAAGNAGGGSITVGSPNGQPKQTSARRGSAADKRGANWANADAKRRVSAITRPIKVQVSGEQLAILESDGGSSAGGAAVVTFQQPTERMLDQLADAVRQQIGDWGLAGDDMYWRPLLVVQVTPGAERQAARLAELLENSGIDVRLPQTAARPAEGGGRATR
jgi:hypothetical protein